MNTFVRNPRNRTWNAHSHHIKVMFGLRPEAHWPTQGMGPRVLDGIKVWVEPLSGPIPTSGRRNQHRVMAQCPHCAKVLSLGRMHQHKCKGE